MFCLPMNEFAAGPMRMPLTMLLIAVGMVLLIACANIAGLQIARASARQRELAVRVALGASSCELLRQAFIESAVLTTVGVVLGVVAAAIIAAPLLLHSLPHMLSAQLNLSVRGPVLLFVWWWRCLFPALRSGSRVESHASGWFDALQEGSRSGTTGVASQRARSSLAVAQIALSLLLLAGAGLMLSSLQALQRVEVGFDSRDLLSGSVSLPPTVYDKEEKQATFYSALAGTAAQHSGSEQRRALRRVALQQQWRLRQLRHQGQAGRRRMSPDRMVASALVSSDYFSTLRIPMLMGRAFTDQDRKGSAAGGRR